MNEENIRFQDILDALSKRWQFILCVTLIITIGATALTFFFVKPKYEAGTRLFIGKQATDSSDSYDNNEVQMYQKLLKTYADIIDTRDLVESAINDAGLDLDAGIVLSNLTVTAKNDTQIISINYVSTNREECKDVVESIANRFITVSNELITNSNVKIIEKVLLPESPISPNKKLNIAAALFLGGMLGIALAIILEFMDNTFKDKDQVENIVGLPVLGVIPDSDI